MTGDSSKIRGVGDIKTMQGLRKRTIPRMENSAYLDLYILNQEKFRMNTEKQVVERRMGNLQKRIAEIDNKMDVIKRSQAGKKEMKSMMDSEKKIRTMPVSY